MTEVGAPASRRYKWWMYGMLYLVLALISIIPPFAEKPYAQQDTQDVIISLLMVSMTPYKALTPLFHLSTLVLIGLIIPLKERMGRPLAAYMGVNYLGMAFLPTMGHTAQYGFVVQTGALVASLLLGIAWIVVAMRDDLKPSFGDVPAVRYLFLPLALLAFWGPYNEAVQPDFDLPLLLTSEYGLAYCFTTPVFLFLLVLFYPRVNRLVYQAMAFNGLLYGLFNMTHFASAATRWMGVLHLPLLILSVYALLLPRIATPRAA